MLVNDEILNEERDDISVPSMMFPRTEEELARDIEKGKIYRLSDAFFKHAFGKPESEKRFLDLINTLVFPDRSERFTHAVFANSEHIPDKYDGKSSRYDILCILDDGEPVNLEVQVQRERDYIKRTLCYWSMIYATQIKKSSSYTAAKRTISVSILGFELYKERPDFWSSSSVRDDKYFTRTCDDLLLIYIEMPKFFRQIKSGLKPGNKLDRWLFYLSGMEGDEMEAVANIEPEIKETMRLEQLYIQDDLERLRYISRLKDEMDEIARREREEKREAKIKAQEKDIKTKEEKLKTMEEQRKAMEEQRKTMEEQLRLREEAEKRTVLNLFAMNQDTLKISEITGLTPEEVEQIRADS